MEKYSGQFKLRLPKSLHRQLTQHSKREGVSMNQYCVYLLAKMMYLWITSSVGCSN
nr:toxin-antitoxin system HicB family antitoxin [Enterocloster citroniae]